MSALLDARMGLNLLQVWRPKPLFPVDLGRRKREKPSVMGSILCHSYAQFGRYFPMAETGYAVEGCVVASNPAHARALLCSYSRPSVLPELQLPHKPTLSVGELTPSTYQASVLQS